MGVAAEHGWRCVQVAAYTNGRTSVTLQDTLLLRHMLWSRPEDEERIHDWLVARLAAQGSSEKQVNYLLSSLFGRTCHSMQARPAPPHASFHC